MRLDDRFAIEAGGMYSRNTLRADLLMNQTGTPATTIHASDGADVWAGTLKLMFETLPPGSEHNLRVGLGPALITRGGPAYRPVAEGRWGLTDVGAALSICTRVPLGSFADLRLRAEDLVYKARQTWESQTVPGASLRSDPRLQHDFVLSVGLQMGLRRENAGDDANVTWRPSLREPTLPDPARGGCPAAPSRRRPCSPKPL